MTIIAQTARLVIRELLPEEEDIYVQVHMDERVSKYLPKRNADDYHQIFKDTLQSYGDGTGTGRWGMFDKLSGEFIGACLLRVAKEAPEKIELGYAIGVNYWGLGIATEMAKALVNYGFNEAGFSVICAVTHPDNVASQNVLLKAGMHRDGEVFWHGDTLPFFEAKR